MNLRNLAIWGVIVVVLIGLYSMMTGGSQAAGTGQISYSQLLTRVDSGEVKSATIRGATVEIKDAAGKTVPAWFIQEMSAMLNGRTVLSAQWGPSVSKDPYLQFVLKGAKAGDKIGIQWLDNRGERRSDEATIV